MNKIFIAAWILWLFSLLAKKLSPDVFGHDFIQWPLFFLLSLIVPYGLYKMIEEKNALLSFGFMVLFVLSSLSSSISVYKHIDTIDTMYDTLPNMEEDTLLLNAPITLASADKRVIGAKLIFERYGVAVPYKDSEGSFIEFKPSQVNKTAFERSTKIYNDREFITESLFSKVRESLYFLFVQIGLLFCVFGYLSFSKLKMDSGSTR